MSEFKELIKSFPKTREYVRDFFVYGFKTREEFKEKSPRTYDNERRRIESWLSGFVQRDYTPKGKNISLAIDSNLLDTNPLYRVWKTKSFTNNDILLHFYLLDFLSPEEGKSIETITDGILDCYGICFDAQTVRRKCNAYLKEGLLQKETQGKELLYRKSPDFHTILQQYPGLRAALKFYHFAPPLGIIGDTLLDTLSLSNNLFRVKHSFFVHTLEDEILLQILAAIRRHYAIQLHIRSTKNQQERIQQGVPLQIFTSTRTGRRFLCLYSEKTKRFSCTRIDAIKKTTLLTPVEHYTELREKLRRNLPNVWGVSFQNTHNQRLQHVKLTLYINERTETHILTRLEREGKGGTITHIRRNIYTYEKDVFDANEMLPWIRTFIGRIIDLESDCPRLQKQFDQDMEAMYQMYEIKNEEKHE